MILHEKNKRYFKILNLLIFSLISVKSFSQSDLILQGIIDFSVPSGGSDGKAIHVKATQNISDLSIYGIGVANNGGGSDGQEYTFPAISVLAGQDVLVARNVTAMTAYFDVCASEFEYILQSSPGISQNGDDAIELFMNGSVIETYGYINVDGTGTSWEYTDAWAYKDPSGAISFGVYNWIVATPHCTDGTNTIFDASCVYPICSNLPCTLNIDNQTNVSCYGGYDGSLTVSGSGGTGEFYYSIQYFNSFFNMYFELAHSPDTGQYISYPATFMNIPSNCYLITLEDSLGCMDSTTVCITQPDSIYSITNMTVCDYVIWNMNIYTNSGTYNSNLTAANGCDSSAILNLTVNYSDTNITNITECDSAVWDGATYYSSGTYINSYINSSGCDSIEILNLTINNSSSSSFSITSCDSYTWDGVTFTSSGNYTNSYTNVNGCDSLVTLDLIINYSLIDSVFVDACEEYIWSGIIYDSSGVYTNVLINQNGCDSSVILSLNITDSDSSFTNVTACGNYFWNGVNYTQSGNYTFSGTQNFNTYSLNFDGNNDYVEAPSISIYDTIRNDLTLSSWIKLDNSFNNNGSIIARRDFVGNPNGERHHFELTVLSDKSIAFSTANNQNNSLYTAQLQSAANVLTLNNWHYVSCSFENGNVLIYVDGQIVASQNFGYKEMYPNSHWLNFGIVHRSLGNQFFNEFEGQITNVEIWAKVLSQSEIQNNMMCSPLANEPSLVGYWNFKRVAEQLLTI